MFTLIYHRTFIMKIIFSIILSILLVSSFVSNAQVSSQPQFKVVGYLGSWMGYNGMVNFSRNFDFTRVTHINLAFKDPSASGDLNAFLPEEDTLVKWAHKNNVKVLISLAGGATSGNQTWINRYKDLMSESKRAGFIAKLTQYVLDHNLDGIDVDLEGNAIVPDLYDSFIVELNESLKGNDKLITAALSTGYGGGNVFASTLLYFDWVSIMAYDAVGPWSGNPGAHHSSFDFAVSNLNYWRVNKGLAKEKCILGLPFYGYGFQSNFSSYGYTYKYLVNNFPGAEDEDTVGSYIYYNGQPTIEAKTHLAMQQGGGVMIWELSQDATGDASLLKTIFETGILSNKEATLESERIKVYPVPASQNIFIDTDLRNYQAMLTTVEGIAVVQGKNMRSISVENIPKGIYILNITSEEGDLHKKIVVE